MSMTIRFSEFESQFTAEAQGTQRLRRDFYICLSSAPPLRPLRLCGESSSIFKASFRELNGHEDENARNVKIKAALIAAFYHHKQ